MCGDEFLEARITPEQIELWIEPEQRGSERQGTDCIGDADFVNIAPLQFGKKVLQVHNGR